LATIKQYALSLWRVHASVARKLGVELEWGALDKRVQAMSTDLVLAGVVKALTDKGVLTDTELNTVFNQISRADLPPLSVNVHAPRESEKVPDPDLGT
jgi:uncharacterized membrane protein